MININFTGIVENVESKTVKGKTLVTLYLKTTKKAKENGDVDSVWDIQCWGKMAEFVQKASKGDHLVCIGFLEMNHWEYNGKNYSKPKITLMSVGFSNYERNYASTQARQSYNQGISENDLPF